MVTTSRQRLGISAVELIGCLFAVVGGIYIGAVYTGVNLEHAAHDALVRSELLESVPERWRPRSGEPTKAEQAMAESALRDELAALRKDIEALDVDNAQSKSTASVVVIDDDCPTCKCWSRLSEIAFRDEQLQRDCDSRMNDANAVEVFKIKARISRISATQARTMPYDGVDERVKTFARQLSDWYDRKSVLYDKAVEAWESSTKPQVRAMRLSEWKRDELQHRYEASLIQEKANGLRAALVEKYGQQFPPFGSPATGADANFSLSNQGISR